MKSNILLIVACSLFVSGNLQASGDPVAGKEKSATCQACHGEAGISSAPNFPNLAGQHKDYLYHALMAYKSGDRKNAIMGGMVSALTNQDMHDLAAYYADKDGLFSIDTLH